MQEILTQSERYVRYARAKTLAHFRMAHSVRGYHNTLGVPASLAATIVGTSIFATINSPEQHLWLQIGAGLLSLGAATLSGLQTFFKFSETAAQHQEAASDFSEVWHALDIFVLRHRMLFSEQQATSKELEDAFDTLVSISKRMDDIDRRAPTIPDEIYNAAKDGPQRATWRPESRATATSDEPSVSTAR
jgi:hypothetical protein